MKTKSQIVFPIIAFMLTFWVNQVNGQEALDLYLQEAAENHPILKARYDEYLAALERVPQVGSLPDPQLSFGYFISPVETRVGPQRFKFSISQMFPWFGTLDKEKSVQAEYAKAKFELFQEAKKSLFRDISKQYYEIILLQQIGELIEENIVLLESLKSLATQRFENNQGDLVEVIEVGIAINDLDNRLLLNNDLLSTNSRNFNLSIGRSPEAEIDVSPGDEISLTLSDTTAFDQHPSLKNIEHEINSFDQKIALIKSNGRPQLGIGLDYLIVSERSGEDISDNGQNAFMPMVSMSLPIFRKKYKAATREAELLKQSRQEVYNNQKLLLSMKYENSAFAFKKARRELDLYSRQIAETESAIDLLVTTYSAGETSFEKVLEMNQTHLNYQIEEQRALKDVQVSIADMNYLMDNEI